MRIWLGILCFNTVNQWEIMTQSICKAKGNRKINSKKVSGQSSSIQLVHPLYTSMRQIIKMSFHGEVTQLDGSRSRSLSPNPQRASHWWLNYKLPTKEVQGKNEFETKVSNFLFKSALITIFHFKPTIKVDWLATVAVLDWNISSSCFIMIHDNNCLHFCLHQDTIYYKLASVKMTLKFHFLWYQLYILIIVRVIHKQSFSESSLFPSMLISVTYNYNIGHCLFYLWSEPS